MWQVGRLLRRGGSLNQADYSTTGWMEQAV